MKKPILYTELAYVLGVLLVALGTALMEKADLGMSMVVAPAYVVYRWLSRSWSFFTFGMAEYCLQAALLLVMMLLLRRFRVSYLLSFVTAVLYGLALDGCMAAAAFLPAAAALWQRLALYVPGFLLCAAGVSMMFHTYLSPEVYELFVKEVSLAFSIDTNRFKTGYDCVSCALAIVMSFLIFGFGRFVGVQWGTVICALINGWTIGRFSALFERLFAFRDRFSWRPFFTGAPPVRDE